MTARKCSTATVLGNHWTVSNLLETLKLIQNIYICHPLLMPVTGLWNNQSGFHAETYTCRYQVFCRRGSLVEFAKSYLLYIVSHVIKPHCAQHVIRWLVNTERPSDPGNIASGTHCYRNVIWQTCMDMIHF